jgi:glutamyl-tRNA synthetase
VGGARTALFNFLFARNQGGSFLLRIEDTDRERSSEEMTRSILEALDWLGLEHDGPVVHQADRMDRHRELVGHLLEAEAAYRCFCSESDLEDRGGEECPCRGLDPREARERAEEDEEYAVRFRTPRTGRTEWSDVVHGASGVDNESGEAVGLLRSDGRPG